MVLTDQLIGDQRGETIDYVVYEYSYDTYSFPIADGMFLGSCWRRIKI